MEGGGGTWAGEGGVDIREPVCPSGKALGW